MVPEHGKPRGQRECLVRLNSFAVAGLAAVALVTATTPSPACGQRESFDDSTCLDIGLTKDNLMVASNSASARKYADTLETYSPPDSVKAAIEHFVATGGAQPNDADLDANKAVLTGWLKQNCPNLKNP
jgi:hypothetical protein